MNIDDVPRVATLIRAQFPDGTFERPGMNELLDMYAIIALTKGAATTNRDVHHAWLIWARRHDPRNPDLIAYHDLPQAVKDQDSPFARAICAVARTLPE